MEVIRVWCEWDIGQDNKVFKTIDAAVEWTTKALEDNDLDEPITVYEADGLVSYESLEVMGG